MHTETHLLRVVELIPVAVIHAACGPLWIACHCLYVNFQVTFQQLIHLSIIVIIIPTHRGPMYCTYMIKANSALI